MRELQVIRTRLTEVLRADEVITPLVPERLAGGHWWNECVGYPWPDCLVAGILEPRRGYRHRPENLLLAALLAERATPRRSNTARSTDRRLPSSATTTAHRRTDEQIRRVLDLGCGSGSLLLIAHALLNPVSLVGLELQVEMVERLKRTLAAHELDTVHVVQGDLRDDDVRQSLRLVFQEECGQSPPPNAEGGHADLVVMNPPYFPSDWGRQSAQESTHLSTHAVHGGVGEFLDAALSVLSPRGELYMVYDVQRLGNVLMAASRRGLFLRALWLIPDQRPGFSDSAFRAWIALNRDTGAQLRSISNDAS